MQGRNQFQGGVPSNMNFPTDTYANAHSQAYRDVGQAYVNAAQMEAQAKTKMVSDLAQGAIGGLSAYKQGADAKKDFSANMAMLKSPSYRNVLGLSEKQATDLQSEFSKIQGDSGYGAANKAFSQLTDPLMKYAEVGRRYSQEQGLIATRADAANQQAAFETLLRLKAMPSAAPAAAPAAAPMATPAAPAVSTANPIQPAERKRSPWESYNPVMR
jgi:hypothetical protein